MAEGFITWLVKRYEGLEKRLVETQENNTKVIAGIQETGHKAAMDISQVTSRIHGQNGFLNDTLHMVDQDIRNTIHDKQTPK